jgi:hypothetical protein
VTQAPQPWQPGEAPAAADERRHAPATLRNRDAILAVLRDHLPTSGSILEIASGSGEHVCWFADQLPALVWQPSDPDLAALTSITAWSKDVSQGTVLSPLLIDAARLVADWPVAHADAILCCNMVHIAPWEATIGLMAGAGALLPSGAPLILYGPFIQEGVETAPSNRDFDASLRSRNDQWGLRTVAAVAAEAKQNGLTLDLVLTMPANNLSLIFRKN